MDINKVVGELSSIRWILVFIFFAQCSSCDSQSKINGELQKLNSNIQELNVILKNK